MNKYIVEHLCGIQKILMAKFNAEVLNSSASKGKNREIFIKNFLEAVLPKIYRFGSGDITDSNNNKSGQIDIVLEFPFYPSLKLSNEKDDSSRLYISESVAAVIEVKSDLSNQWDEVKKTAEQLINVEREFNSYCSSGNFNLKKIPLFVVGYKGWKELKTHEKYYTEYSEKYNILGILDIENCNYQSFEGKGCGPVSLWAFINNINKCIRAILTAEADVNTYIE